MSGKIRKYLNIIPMIFKKFFKPDWLMIITGLIGFYFSFLITVEKMALVADPSHVPPCSIDPFISCGPVMLSWQAEVFGFSNSLIGIWGFSVVTTIGFALLAGARFKKWFWQGIQIGLTFALLFVYWLFYEIVYDIRMLCLYCMAVWAVTIPLFAYVTVYNLKEGHIKLPGKSTTQWAIKHKHYLTALLYLIIIGVILFEFRDYWIGLLY